MDWWRTSYLSAGTALLLGGLVMMSGVWQASVDPTTGVGLLNAWFVIGGICAALGAYLFLAVVIPKLPAPGKATTAGVVLEPSRVLNGGDLRGPTFTVSVTNAKAEGDFIGRAEWVDPESGDVMHHQPWDPPWSRSPTPHARLARGDRDELQVVFVKEDGLVWPESILRNQAFTDHKRPLEDGSKIKVSVTRLGTNLPPASRVFRLEPDDEHGVRLVVDDTRAEVPS